MSNPQIEDGYTSIAHELLEAITIYPFSKMQYKILMVIFRKTYGYGKTVDDIALSHYVKHTRIAKPHVSTTLISIEKLGVIKKTPGVFGFNVSINKHYKKWEKWDSEWDFVEDSIKKQNTHKTTSPKPEPELTQEQNECWQWAKTNDFWQDKVPTIAEFLKQHQSRKATLKTQYSAFKSRMAQPEVKNDRQQYFDDKKSVSDTLAGKNGSIVDRLKNKIIATSGGSIQQSGEKILEGVECEFS